VAVRTRRRPAPAGDIVAAGAALAEAIDAAERQAIVIWRGERIPYRSVPARVAAIDDRTERNRLHASFTDAVEATNHLRAQRLAAMLAAAGDEGNADLVAAAPDLAGYDATQLGLEIERFLSDSETVYFAALRRYLALIDIEQGDSTVADLWHLQRGAGWSRWWDPRRTGAAIESSVEGLGATPGDDEAAIPDAGDWLAGSRALRAAGAGAVGVRQETEATVAAAIRALFGSLVAERDWLGRELGMAEAELPAFADFAAFWRLLQLRGDAAVHLYELKLYRTDEPAIQRGYYAGIVGLQTGVIVPEANYLAAVHQPFAAGRRFRAEMLAGAMAEGLRSAHGAAWWRQAEAAEALRRLAAVLRPEDAVAQFGYDRLDWRPVLRQIRTQLIGEMSGYGGPNITTRAGTRKV